MKLQYMGSLPIRTPLAQLPDDEQARLRHYETQLREALIGWSPPPRSIADLEAEIALEQRLDRDRRRPCAGY